MLTAAVEVANKRPIPESSALTEAVAALESARKRLADAQAIADRRANLELTAEEETQQAQKEADARDFLRKKVQAGINAYRRPLIIRYFAEALEERYKSLEDNQPLKWYLYRLRCQGHFELSFLDVVQAYADERPREPIDELLQDFVKKNVLAQMVCDAKVAGEIKEEPAPGGAGGIPLRRRRGSAVGRRALPPSKLGSAKQRYQPVMYKGLAAMLAAKTLRLSEEQVGAINEVIEKFRRLPTVLKLFQLFGEHELDLLDKSAIKLIELQSLLTPVTGDDVAACEQIFDERLNQVLWDKWSFLKHTQAEKVKGEIARIVSGFRRAPSEQALTNLLDARDISSDDYARQRLQRFYKAITRPQVATYKDFKQAVDDIPLTEKRVTVRASSRLDTVSRLLSTERVRDYQARVTEEDMANFFRPSTQDDPRAHLWLDESVVREHFPERQVPADTGKLSAAMSLVDLNETEKNAVREYTRIVGERGDERKVSAIWGDLLEVLRTHNSLMTTRRGIDNALIAEFGAGSDDVIVEPFAVMDCQALPDAKVRSLKAAETAAEEAARQLSALEESHTKNRVSNREAVEKALLTNLKQNIVIATLKYLDKLDSIDKGSDWLAKKLHGEKGRTRALNFLYQALHAPRLQTVPKLCVHIKELMNHAPKRRFSFATFVLQELYADNVGALSFAANRVGYSEAARCLLDPFIEKPSVVESVKGEQLNTRQSLSFKGQLPEVGLDSFEHLTGNISGCLELVAANSLSSSSETTAELAGPALRKSFSSVVEAILPWYEPEEEGRADYVLMQTLYGGAGSRPQLVA